MATPTNRFLNCPLDTKSISDCDPAGYIIKLALTVVPGIILAALTFLTIFAVCCFRFLCNCCGGRNQSANVCCPPSADKNIPARYSKNDLLRTKLWMFAATGLAVSAIIWGNAASAQFVGGLKDFGVAVSGIPNHIFAKVQEMNESLTLPVYDASTNETKVVALFGNSSVMTEALKVRTTLSDLFSSSMGAYQTGIDSFSFVLFVIFSVPAGMVILGAPLALCNVRRYLPSLLAFVVLFLGIFVWALHGVFAGTSFLVNGICTEVSGIANNRRNVISPLVGCSTSTFTGYIDNFRKLRKDKAQDACNEFVPLCYDNLRLPLENLQDKKVYDCGSTTPNCTDKDLADVADIILGVVIHRNIVDLPNVNATGAVCLDEALKYDCSIPVCADKCRYPSNNSLSETGMLAKQVNSSFFVATSVSVTIDSIGNQFANCDAIMSYLLQPFDEPCQKIVSGADGARDCSGMEGYAVMTAVFALLFGAKRFMSSDMADKAIDAEGKTDEDHMKDVEMK